MVKRTFYDNFCIGLTKEETAVSMTRLREMGLNGIIVSFARESDIKSPEGARELAENDAQLKSWLEFNLETIDRLGSGDLLAVKYTGAGDAATKFLEGHTNALKIGSRDGSVPFYEGPKKVLLQGMRKICTAARDRGVRILVDAEEDRVQWAIHSLTMVCEPGSSRSSYFYPGRTGS